MKYISRSYEDTFNLGKEFALKLKKGDIVTLDGDLGAGKTAFVSGVANGLGLCDKVSSPTFTIVNEYRKGDIPLLHFDVYRLGDIDELYDIGWEDYINGDAVLIIEWADMLKSEIQKEFYEIHIDKLLDIDDDAREISIDLKGEI